MRIIIKIGTSSLTKEDGSINIDIVKDISKTISILTKKGNEVLLVSSGAVGCGKNLVKSSTNINLKNNSFKTKNKYSIVEKTILSGIGQIKLMSYYQEEFTNNNTLIEQVLIAGEKDINNSYFRDNINTCFYLGIVPIINANDTVYDIELREDSNKRFSDNDILAAELASELEADILILVTNVDGYLDENNKVISNIDYSDIDYYLNNTNDATSIGGTGGMYSKLSTCKIANCNTYIINNKEISNIRLLLNGKPIGTKISIDKQDEKVLVKK